MSAVRLLGPLFLVLLTIQAFTTEARAAAVEAKASSILSQGKSGTALLDQLIGHVREIGNYNR